MRMAETRRKMEASFGKRSATLVRRLIWVLSVSHIFEVRNRLRNASGDKNIVRPSGMAFSIHWAKLVSTLQNRRKNYFAVHEPPMHPNQSIRTREI